MRVEPTLSSAPAPPVKLPEPVRTRTYSIESVLVPPQAPTFPRLSRFFNWLWSFISSWFPKKKVEDPPPAPDVLKTIKEAIAKKNAPTPIDQFTKRIIAPAALCGAAVAFYHVAKKSESLARTQLWVGEQQGPLIIGALLGGKALVQLYDYVCPQVRNPGGILERQVSYKGAAFAACLLYTGYKLYDIESVLPSLATAAGGVAKYVWENQFIQPFGFSIPLIGGIPLVSVVKLATSTSIKATNWIAAKMPYRVVKEAAKVTQIAAQTIDELSASIGMVKMGLGMITYASEKVPSTARSIYGLFI